MTSTFVTAVSLENVPPCCMRCNFSPPVPVHREGRTEGLYRAPRIPRSRFPHAGSAPPRGCPRRTPGARAAPRRTAAARAPAPEGPCRSPRPGSRSSPSQTCTSGPRLGRERERRGPPVSGKLALAVNNNITFHIRRPPDAPVTQAVKSAPHATCRMALPWRHSTFLGCR